MKDFKKNNCRVCRKCFCCETCRAKHETNKHQIDPNCDICLYGKVYLKDIIEGVQTHIKAKHWPLHCVLCNRIFGSFEELKLHSNCPMAKSLSDNIVHSSTPPLSTSLKKYDTPPYQNIAVDQNNPLILPNLMATSTPMQRLEDNKLFDLHELLTPVDRLNENKNLNNKMDKTTTIQRTVTFYETPITEVQKKQKNLANTNNENMQDTQSLGKIHTSSVAEIFHSVKESINEKENNEAISLETTEEHSKTDKKAASEEKSICEDSNCMWQSAINMTIETIDEDSENTNFSLENLSPLQMKRRKINVVSPLKRAKEELLRTPACSTQIYHSNDEIINNPKVDNSLNISTNSKYRLWDSVSNILKNVMPNLSTIKKEESKSDLKRSFSDISDSCDEKPIIKRFKLTDIKCRRPIRDLVSFKNRDIQYSRMFKDYDFKERDLQIPKKKVFVDKATQTDF